MTTSQATGRLSTADFVDQYPALFSLYLELMVSTIDCIYGKRKFINGWFDAEVDAATRFCKAEQDAAHRSYCRATRPLFDEYNAACEAAQSELDATLKALKAQRNSVQKPFIDACESALSQLRKRFSSGADQCYLELGLPERVFDRERDGATFRKIVDESTELKAPSEKIYSQKVSEAHRAHFDRSNLLLQKFLSDSSPEYQKRYDATLAAQAAKEKLLSLIAERRKWWLGTILQNWIRRQKQWRLRVIADFLVSFDETLLADRLTGRIEAIKGTLVADRRLLESIASMAETMKHEEIVEAECVELS